MHIFCYMCWLHFYKNPSKLVTRHNKFTPAKERQPQRKICQETLHHLAPNIAPRFIFFSHPLRARQKRPALVRSVDSRNYKCTHASLNPDNASIPSLDSRSFCTRFFPRRRWPFYAPQRCIVGSDNAPRETDRFGRSFRPPGDLPLAYPMYVYVRALAKYGHQSVSFAHTKNIYTVIIYFS